MQPMMTGFATIKSGKYKGKEIPFKIYTNTPLGAVQVFAKNVLFEKPLKLDSTVGKETITKTFGILLRHPQETTHDLIFLEAFLMLLTHQASASPENLPRSYLLGSIPYAPNASFHL